MDKATNFKPEFLPKLDELLEFVQKNPYSDFYRKRLGTQETHPKSYQDLAVLPLLTKEDILNAPLSERIFVPEEDITFFSYSSGTTNSANPLIVAQSYWDNENFENNLINQDLLESVGANRIMALMSPMGAVYTRLVSIPFRYSRVLQGDIHNLKLMAKIFKEADVKGVYTTPTILDYFIKELEAVGFKFETMKWILLNGELCSSPKYKYLQRKFPNALIDFGYGISEINGARHYRCEYLRKKEPYLYHTMDGTGIIEILDESGDLLPMGEVGQLVHTDLKPKAFPMIRYKTGDMCSLNRIDCPCGNNLVLQVGGRANYDVLRFYGGTLHSELIARALEEFKDSIFPDFRLRVSEKEMAGTGLKPSLELQLKLEPTASEKKSDPYFIEKMRDSLSKNIFISAKSTIHDMVANGAFLPLELKFIDEFEGGLKTKRIISELS